MDFDSIVSLLLILLFFFFPTLIRRLNQKKKTGKPVQAGKPKGGNLKKMSLFEKLGEQIREYAQTLEQEAKKARQPQESQENIWDHLAEETNVQTSPETFFEEEFEPEPPVFVPKKRTETKRDRPALTPEKHVPASQIDTPGPGKLSTSRLQQAIIWSEILSKPVALRKG
jgi:hypothetical protein